MTRRSAARAGNALALAVALVTVSCSKGVGCRGGTKETSSGGPGPVLFGSLPGLAQGSRPAVRANGSVGPFVAGIALEARALISTVTTGDPLRIALRLRPEKPPVAGDAWSTEHVARSKLLEGLRFEVKTAGGNPTLTLAAAPPPTYDVSLSQLMEIVGIEGGGLHLGTDVRPWKAPQPDVLAAPGKVVVTVIATLATEKETRELRAGPITFEVVAPSASHRTHEELVRESAEAARRTWESKAQLGPSDPLIDDVDGNLSSRFRRASEGSGRTGYDDEILEVFLDRAGKELAVDRYLHFTCIAEGTPVETPRGPVPIEDLGVGAEVVAYDPVAGVASIARVQRLDRGAAEDLWSFGDLVVTGRHPVWADGRWQDAGEVEAGAVMLELDADEVTEVVAEPLALRALGPRIVYDVTVSPPHTFFAGGVLVHNKAVHVPLGGGEATWGPLFYRRAAAP